MKKTTKIIDKQKKIQAFLQGFTLIELLVVIAVVGLLASVVLVALNGTRNKAKSALAISNQKQLQKAVEMYNIDIGFYPPDVNRGWDPGITKPLPSNKDLGFDCNVDASACTCPSGTFPPCGVTPFPLPADWMSQVINKWRGPYTAVWPNTAPWGGKYDFNNWNVTTNRYGCDVPAGVYIGTQRNYDESNPIPADQEQWFLNQKLDSDNCLNGEVQLMLIKY
jgi:prepilin-type N-terminal cleavage/methylation domain-containing protein